MDWTGFFSEVINGSLGMLKTVALILFPLLIGVEIVDDLGLLDKFSSLFAPILRNFKLPKDASLPLIVAQVFGITYGAGLIIRSVEEDRLSASELMTMAVFLMVCHAVVEDTLLFVAIGGNGLIMLGSRVVLAVFITYLYTRYFVKGEEVDIEVLSEAKCH
ncbi:nucleoside recognition domain-containing protein [Orenia metallireducens]|uniref:Nucleoside recognition domain-containing protein n=1 Tax=Orenia metallireducens TaxID=1413210 RepID=A0A1C0A9H7_9FIRM|nr:nucleoside recognition domain-containing protein [Orenia metallireducens]OCL26913.1 nucleoside recognition domain-containing protein [Orenia metallireducens]